MDKIQSNRVNNLFLYKIVLIKYDILSAFANVKYESTYFFLIKKYFSLDTGDFFQLLAYLTLDFVQRRSVWLQKRLRFTNHKSVISCLRVYINGIYCKQVTFVVSLMLVDCGRIPRTICRSPFASCPRPLGGSLTFDPTELNFKYEQLLAFN